MSDLVPKSQPPRQQCPVFDLWDLIRPNQLRTQEQQEKTGGVGYLLGNKQPQVGLECLSSSELSFCNIDLLDPLHSLSLSPASSEPLPAPHFPQFQLKHPLLGWRDDLSKTQI